MALYTVKSRGHFVVEFTHEVEAGSREAAEELFHNGEGKEIDFEFISCSDGPTIIGVTEEGTD